MIIILPLIGFVILMKVAGMLFERALLDRRPSAPQPAFWPTKEEELAREQCLVKLNEPDLLMDRFNAFMFEKLSGSKASTN